jgi:hypothetical protein
LLTKSRKARIIWPSLDKREKSRKIIAWHPMASVVRTAKGGPILILNPFIGLHSSGTGIGFCTLRLSGVWNTKPRYS